MTAMGWYMNRNGVVTLGALAGAALSSCQGSNCLETVVGPVISVTDVMTGSSICDAEVTVIDGPAFTGGAHDDAGHAVLGPNGGRVVDAAGCTYDDIPLGQAGTYTLQVAKPGYQTATASGVVVVSYPCHSAGPYPAPQRVDVKLTPQ